MAEPVPAAPSEIRFSLANPKAIEAAYDRTQRRLDWLLAGGGLLIVLIGVVVWSLTRRPSLVDGYTFRQVGAVGLDSAYWMLAEKDGRAALFLSDDAGKNWRLRSLNLPISRARCLAAGLGFTRAATLIGDSGRVTRIPDLFADSLRLITSRMPDNSRVVGYVPSLYRRYRLRHRALPDEEDAGLVLRFRADLGRLQYRWLGSRGRWTTVPVAVTDSTAAETRVVLSNRSLPQRAYVVTRSEVGVVTLPNDRPATLRWQQPFAGPILFAGLDSVGGLLVIGRTQLRRVPLARLNGLGGGATATDTTTATALPDSVRLALTTATALHLIPYSGGQMLALGTRPHTDWTGRLLLLPRLRADYLRWVGGPNAEARYTRAATAGDADAMNCLGLIQENYWGAQHDYAQARSWYEKAAKAGNAVAMNILGRLYNNGQGVARNYELADRWYTQAAAAGNTLAMRNLGALYFNGRGVVQNHEQAWAWYARSAATGNTDSMFNLGVLYANGQGVVQDYEQAWAWYARAAAAGDVRAINNLGVLYANGQGPARDYLQARVCFAKAAIRNAWAMYNLGSFHENGLGGVPKDETLALQWYRKAALSGNAVAMRVVGSFLANGRGALMNRALAWQWFQKAAQKGDAVAMESVAMFFKNGYIVTQNDDSARYWYTRAAAAGNTNDGWLLPVVGSESAGEIK